MYVATLIAPPTVQLTDALANRFTNALNGEGVTWLSNAEACDIALKAEPDGFEAVWADAQAAGLDLVVQPMAGRRKKVLLADMDSTMIQQECIDELADEAGIGAHVADITARAMNGELEFDAALRERVGLLKGLPSSVIADVLATRITLMPGGAVLLATMKADGAYCALVSGGFTDFTAAIAARLRFDENRANILLHEDGKLSGQVAEPILGKQAKVDALSEITTRLGLGVDDVIAVGDGANDLGMLTLAGRGVALHAKPFVAAQCNTRLNFADLTGLLFVQGYAKADWVGV